MSFMIDIPDRVANNAERSVEVVFDGAYIPEKVDHMGRD